MSLRSASGLQPTPTDRTLGEGIRCDAAGCIGKLKDRSLVAIAKTLEAFEEDCRRAVLVVSSRDAPPGCAALVIDRGVWRRSGALTLHRRGEQFEITAARPPGYDRPWARAAAPAGEALEPSRTTPARPRDATPRQDDLEAGDCEVARRFEGGTRRSISPEQADQLALD